MSNPQHANAASKNQRGVYTTSGKVIAMNFVKEPELAGLKQHYLSHTFRLWIH